MGFDGSPGAYLSYNYLRTVPAPNSPANVDRNPVNLILFSFHAQRIEGMILLLQDEVCVSVVRIVSQQCNVTTFRMVMSSVSCYGTLLLK